MQKGQIFIRGKSWVVKFYEYVMENGQPKKRRVLKKICASATSDGQPISRADAEIKASQMFLSKANSQTTPASADTLLAFLELVYMPAVQKELRPSTYDGYNDMFQLVKPHLKKQRLCDVKTSHIKELLQAVANTPAKHGGPRAKTTMFNCRNFLSGAFRLAIEKGMYQDQNPTREVRMPKNVQPMNEDTYAYSLKEELAMAKAVPEPARTVILTASFSGFRHSELRGLRWPDYTGETIKAQNAVWGTHVGPTKTEQSRDKVDVIVPLRKVLDAHKKRFPSASGYIFEGSTGKPLNLANLTRRVIRPVLKEAGIEWHGWHAFRRGLSTNLHELGVPDITISRICRHTDVATTRKHYIKTRDEQTEAAMRKLEKALVKAKRAGR